MQLPTETDWLVELYERGIFVGVQPIREATWLAERCIFVGVQPIREATAIVCSVKLGERCIVVGGPHSSARLLAWRAVEQSSLPSLRAPESVFATVQAQEPNIRAPRTPYEVKMVSREKPAWYARKKSSDTADEAS